MSRRGVASPGLAGHDRGVAAVEFAMVLPVFLLLLLGGIELCHMLYLRSVLYGEIDQAARASSLESAQEALSDIDTRVSDVVRSVAPDATVTFRRRAYRSYANVRNRAEPFSDANSDGVCSNGESFTDLNTNGQWDIDSGAEGAGGARQIVVYDIDVQFPPLFPYIADLFPGAFTVKTSTQLRNQPYAAGTSSANGVCP